jgi:hypothetical protein
MLRYLLDKNVIRRLIKGLWLGDQAGVEEQLALALWFKLRAAGHALYMSVETAHILERLPAYREIGLVSNTVEVMEAGRYFKRWAHRLREQGFTREDAKVLSLATFGTDAKQQILGVGTILTFDRPLINHFRQQQGVLRSRLTAMTDNLLLPYAGASLPAVSHPAELWTYLFI